MGIGNNTKQNESVPPRCPDGDIPCGKEDQLIDPLKNTFECHDNFLLFDHDDHQCLVEAIRIVAAQDLQKLYARLEGALRTPLCHEHPDTGLLRPYKYIPNVKFVADFNTGEIFLDFNAIRVTRKKDQHYHVAKTTSYLNSQEEKFMRFLFEQCHALCVVAIFYTRSGRRPYTPYDERVWEETIS